VTACWDRSVVFDQHDWCGGPARHGTVESIELLEMRHEIGAAFGCAGVDDELARDMIERTQHGHFFGLPRAGTRRSAPAFAEARAR